MRLWSIHPKYLDVKGLSGLWREALLARKVLLGETEKYKNHPQLIRFKKQKTPERFINSYLLEIWKESKRRGYNFLRERIGKGFTKEKIKVRQGQINYEFEHLKKKLKIRSSEKYKELLLVKKPDLHPIFVKVKGKIEVWERIS